MKLPAYNPSRLCVKCGSEDVTTSYHSNEGRDCHYGRVCWGQDVVSEHLLRCCMRCGFDWVEATLEG